jgi:short-subunit dehydrogenase
VLALADAGFDVAVVARGEAGTKAAVADVEARGRRGLALCADVADARAVLRAGRAAEDGLGPVTVWVNNAMTTVFSPVSQLDADDIRRATEVTYLGQVHGTLAALELMRPRDRGVIVSVGSVLAFRAIPLQAAYCGAKFATRGFMESVRTELLAEGSGISVAQVHLPAVDTPQFGWCRSVLDPHPQPVPPIHTPDEVASRIVATALRPRRQRVVGTWNRGIAVANKVAPGVLDHFAALTGIDSQQADHLPAPGPHGGNLREPLDDDADRGARGVFGDRSGGLLDPAFLRTVPTTALAALRAIGARSFEVAGQHLGTRSR